MRKNVNKMALCGNFFNIHGFTYNRTQFFEAYMIYLYVNIITKNKNYHFNSNKVIV